MAFQVETAISTAGENKRNEVRKNLGVKAAKTVKRVSDVINRMAKLRVLAEMGCRAKETLPHPTIATARLDPSPLFALFCVSIPQGLS
jgi:hypothetical protein